MKLYNIYEDIILEGLITEGVNTQQIIDTIDGEQTRNGKKFIRRIKIHYDGDDKSDKFGNVTREGKGWRNIVVHALGNLKNGGREVIRAYQVYGDSLRTPNNSSGWKLFRTDRITHWEPTNLKYWEPIEVAGQPTNMLGDDSMSNVEAIVNFDVDTSSKNGDNVNNRNVDNTYRYDNADDTIDVTSTPEREVEPEVNVDNAYQYDDTDVNVDDTEIDNNIDNDYEEEDIDDNDEIKDF